MPIESPITERHRLVIGDDKTVRIDVTDENGAAKNMTGWALTWEIKSSRTSSTALVTKTTSDGISIGNGAGTGDRATITIADTDLEDTLSEGTYWHQLRRTDAGNEELLSYGSVKIYDHGYGS